MNSRPPTATLGTHISNRRNELGLSQAAAAKRAGVSRGAWIAWEKGTSVPEKHNHARIESALHWEPGSVAVILERGTPSPREGDVIPLHAAALPPDDAFVRELRAMAIPDAWRDTLIREYWKEKAKEAEELQDKYRRMARAAEG